MNQEWRWARTNDRSPTSPDIPIQILSKLGENKRRAGRASTKYRRTTSA